MPGESQASIVRRDITPENKNVSQLFEESMQSLKAGFEDLAQKVGVS